MTTLNIFERAVQDPCAVALDMEDLFSEDYSADINGCPMPSESIIQVPRIQVSPTHNKNGRNSTSKFSPTTTTTSSSSKERKFVATSPDPSARSHQEPVDVYNHLVSYNMDSGLSSTTKRKRPNDHDPLSPPTNGLAAQTPVRIKRKNSSAFIDQLSRQPSFVNAGIFATVASQGSSHSHCNINSRSAPNINFALSSNATPYRRVSRVNSMSVVPSLVLGREGRHARSNSACLCGYMDSPAVKSSSSISIPSHVYGLDKYVCCKIDALTAVSGGE